MTDSEWTQERIVRRQEWADGLVTLTCEQRPDFLPGQFAMVALPDDDPLVRRAYTIASAPGQPLELFIAKVPGGQVSRRLADTPVGGTIAIHRSFGGLFTRKKVCDASALWLMGTSTGLAPYISMIRHGHIFDRHDRIIVVHGVRRAKELAYREELEQLSRTHPLTWIPCVSEEPISGGVHGHITEAFTSGALEERADERLDPEHAHAMLCGDPAMVKKMMVMLMRQRKMPLYKPRSPGRVTIECYW